MPKQFLLIFTFAFSLIANAATLAVNIYTGTGEATIANITPEQAKTKAREQAMLDILQQATGINISSQQLVVNENMASYHILLIKSARVINSQCKDDIQKTEQGLLHIATCTG